MDVRVGIAGATGALGSEVVRVLDKAPWRPSQVVPMASARTTVSSVTYGEQRVTVEDLAFEAFGELDALIVALPSAVATGVVARAIAEGVPVVDASGAPGLPLVVPWVNPEALQSLDRPAVAIPGAATTALASALGPLARAGVSGEVDATVLLPASVYGAAGIDELSKQVVALFNAGTPPRKIFDGGLAFDLNGQLGAVQPNGWTEPERLVAEQVATLTGWAGEVRVQLVLVPLFSGVSLQVSMRTARRVPAELAARLLADGGARVAEDARSTPRPRRVEGKAFLHVGRVRNGPSGDGLHLWGVMDNLRTGAAAAVGACGHLVRRSE